MDYQTAAVELMWQINNTDTENILTGRAVVFVKKNLM